ncbi:MAG: tRNA-dependent cyclodipeptide synthase [Rhodospirillales bacterium]|nr:tRNA-dependent cyclodipeptide synthase [Rhodospirillales bacterium]
MINPTRDRKNWLTQNRCVLGISLHNPLFSGENLLQIIHWINNQTQFDECIVNVADVLNRHNYMIFDSLDQADALKKSYHHGDSWLNRHMTSLECLNMPFHIMRWSRWLDRIEYNETHEQIKNAYREHSPFKQAVIYDAMKYFKRKGYNEDQVLPKEMSASVSYILEELAVYSIFFGEYSAVKIYPAKEMESFKILRYGKVPNVSRGLTNYYHGRIVFNPDKIQSDTLDLPALIIPSKEESNRAAA